MKTSPLTLSGILAALVLPLTAPAQQLLVHYGFDDHASGRVRDLSGNERHADIISPSADISPSFIVPGVSGLDTDKAYENVRASSDGKKITGAVIANLGTKPFARQASFTVTGWYKTAAGKSPEIADRLLELHHRKGSNMSIFYSSKEPAVGSFRLAFGGDEHAESKTSARYASRGKWVFFALAYDGTRTSQNVFFYAGGGAPDEVLELVSVSDFAAGAWADRPASPEASIVIGNRRDLERGLAGHIDEFRFYGESAGANGAMSREQIEAIRLHDLRR